MARCSEPRETDGWLPDMMDDGKWATTKILVKVFVFTLLVPGTVVVMVPYLILPDASLDGVDVLGVSLLGLLPILLGAALYVRCAYDFVRRGGGTPAPVDPPVQLVVDGPYRYARNPMYISVLAILAGEALMYRTLPLFYYLLGVAAVLHLVVVSYEELALRRQFGEAYSRYCAAVPRWLPRWVGVKAIYRATFSKVGAVVFAAGVVAHLLRLFADLPVVETPDSIHAFLVVLPFYAGLGGVVFARQVVLTGVLRKTIFAAIVALLLITGVMHLYSIVARDSAWLGIFPLWYSVLAMIVYGGFALFLKTRTLAGALLRS